MKSACPCNKGINKQASILGSKCEVCTYGARGEFCAIWQISFKEILDKTIFSA